MFGGHSGCNNRSELPLSLLVNAKLWDKSELVFMAHVGDGRLTIREGYFFLYLLLTIFTNLGKQSEKKNLNASLVCTVGAYR